MPTLHMKLGDSAGQLVTDLAREKAWQNGQKAEGVLTLMRCCIGMDDHQATQIIEGKAKLITADDEVSMVMVSDDWEAPDEEVMIQEILGYVDYAGLTGVSLRNQQLRIPFKEMRYFGPEVRSNDNLRLEVEARRVLETAKSNLILGLKHARELHLWSLSVFGPDGTYARRAEEEEEALERMGQEEKGAPLDDLLAATQASIASIPGMGPEVQERLLRGAKGITDGLQGRVRAVPDETFEHDTGWMDRNGTYYGCEVGQHIFLSKILVNRDFSGSKGDPQQVLEGLGWLPCTGRQWTSTDKLPTTNQIAALERWTDKWGTPYKGDKENRQIRWDGSWCFVHEIRDAPP